METQPTGLEPFIQALHELLRLFLGAAVTYRIVRIAGQRYVWPIPVQPAVEYIVEKQIRQKRTNYPTLGCSTLTWNARSILKYQVGFQPPLDVLTHPAFLR